jgi:hypothetical protein
VTPLTLGELFHVYFSNYSFGAAFYESLRTMNFKSMQLGERAKLSFIATVIKSQFCTNIRRAPVGTDLSDQVVIVTGNSNGLGYLAAHHLLFLNLAHLILAVRSADKGEFAADSLRIDHPSAKIEVWSLEMASYESIQAFAQRARTDLAARYHDPQCWYHATRLRSLLYRP